MFKQNRNKRCFRCSCLVMIFNMSTSKDISLHLTFLSRYCIYAQKQIISLLTRWQTDYYINIKIQKLFFRGKRSSEASPHNHWRTSEIITKRLKTCLTNNADRVQGAWPHAHRPGRSQEGLQKADCDSFLSLISRGSSLVHKIASTNRCSFFKSLNIYRQKTVIIPHYCL